MYSVEGAEVQYAGGQVGTPLGMVSLPISFDKDMAPHTMKFLVMQKLTPSCIIGIDGQDQIKLRLDREQDLVWIMGQPITLGRSDPEAIANLGSISMTEAFKDKVKRLENSKKFTDYYQSSNTDCLVLDDENMSFENEPSDHSDVQINERLSDNNKGLIKKLLVKFKHMFGYFKKDTGYKSSVTNLLSTH